MSSLDRTTATPRRARTRRGPSLLALGAVVLVLSLCAAVVASIGTAASVRPGFDKGGSYSERSSKRKKASRKRADRLKAARAARKKRLERIAKGEKVEITAEEKALEAEFTEEQLASDEPVEDVIAAEEKAAEAEAPADAEPAEDELAEDEDLADDEALVDDEAAPAEEVVDEEIAEPAPAELAPVDEDAPVTKGSPAVETVVAKPLTPAPAVLTVADPVIESGVGTVTLLTSELPAMAAGQSGWISLNWLAAKLDATSFRVTATEASGAVKISYPENTKDHSSLYRESFLLAGGTDYTSFRFEVAPDASSSVEIVFHVEYLQTSSTSSKLKSVAKPFEQDFSLKLPIVDAEPDAVALATKGLTVSASTPTWQEIPLTATGVGVTDVRVTLVGPAGLGVVYPGDDTYTSLSAGASLNEGDKDVAGVRLDASGLKPGTYSAVVVVLYGRGQSQGVKHEIELVVTK